MAIVPLKKMTLYGAESQRESVIDQLQELGCAHLINLSSTPEDYASGDESKDSHDALRFLRDCPQQLRQVSRKDRFDRGKIVPEVVSLQSETDQFHEERDELYSAIADLEPWGEFRLPSGNAVGDVQFWFYTVRLKDVKEFKQGDYAWKEISRDQQFANLVILASEEPTDVPGELCKLDPRPLSELRARLEVVEEHLEELHHQRVGLTRWGDLIGEALDEAEDAAARDQATQKMLHGERVFALQAWIPKNADEDVRRFAEQHDLAVTIEAPADDEQPPTLLQHSERVAGSEALVTFYKTPNYRSWDPSILAYVSFAIFFAMIIADAGYGIVLALLTRYLWKRLGKTQNGRRSRNVLATLVTCTIVYGVICGSYFGVTPPPDSILGRMRLLDAESQAVMMPISILIGVVHLSLANLAIAWIQRRSLTALAPLGWVAVLIGSSLLGFGMFAEASESLTERLNEYGFILLIGGLVSVFLFSSPRPIFSFSIKNHAWRLLEGFQGLTGFSGLFGDVLSYLRLFALGLSSAKLAQTFNALGANAWDEAGFGVIAAIAIILLGHTLNLVLCLMSAVVHGLRLNCIEFFKWALPEEGYLYKAFSKKARQT